MKTAPGDVIICHKPNVSIRLVAVVRDEGEEPDDIKYWRPEGRISAEEIARATVDNTGGRIFIWDGYGELERIDNNVTREP
jgi:hypothetical protein